MLQQTTRPQPFRESNKSRVARAARISATLAELYPEARISLDFATPWQCLVATILSAQCTDERVNRTTPELFRRIPDVTAMAGASLEEIQRLIQSTGFFRQKSRALQAAARRIVEYFSGNVPTRMEELLTLPGVGRKTANVLLGHVFGQPGLVVDTHVRRLSLRLGLAHKYNPDEIESELQKLRPPDDWTPFSMRLILHGRLICHARAPGCLVCQLRPNCPRIGIVRKMMKRGGAGLNS
jgi:endonuclease III